MSVLFLSCISYINIKLLTSLNAYFEYGRSTISAAYAGFLDQELGSLSADKYADFVVLPVDSWDQLAGDLPTTVLATYVNGKQAYP